MTRLSRRALLRGAGSVAIGLPVLEVMTPKKAYAAVAPRRLFTHTYSLAELGEALAATAERPEGFVKALVLP